MPPTTNIYRITAEGKLELEDKMPHSSVVENASNKSSSLGNQKLVLLNFGFNYKIEFNPFESRWKRNMLNVNRDANVPKRSGIKKRSLFKMTSSEKKKKRNGNTKFNITRQNNSGLMFMNEPITEAMIEEFLAS